MISHEKKNLYWGRRACSQVLDWHAEDPGFNFQHREERGDAERERQRHRERDRQSDRVSKQSGEWVGYESDINFQLRKTKQREKLNPKQAEGNNKDNGKINEIE